MRFQVTQVMDAIEQRLTTDLAGAQAVVDLGEVVRHADLDGGRPVNLVRIGMVVDALSRYLLDGGAMLYGVVGRPLLSEAALTSKERMVLSRWADDGLIEIIEEPASTAGRGTAGNRSAGNRAAANRLAGDRAAGGGVASAAAERAVEIADLTGLPLIALSSDGEAGSHGRLAARFPWLKADLTGSGVPGRVLRLAAGHGYAVLSAVPSRPGGGHVPEQRTVARAPVAASAAVDQPAPAAADAPESAVTEPGVTESAVTEPGVAESAVTEPGVTEPAGSEPAVIEPVVAKSAVTESGVTEPVVTEPVVAEPVVAEPVVAESVVAEPKVAELDAPESVVSESVATEPAIAAAEAPVPAPRAGRASFQAGAPGGAQAAAGMAEAAVAAESAASAASAGGVAVAAAFSARGSAGPAPIRLSRSRYLRAAPNPAHRALLGRQWRCEELDCPAFGEHRQIGQPVPLLRDARATCPRHGVPLTDIGPRPPAYAVSIVVDDLPCRRLVVRHGAPVSVGSAERDPDVFSLAPWLHRAAVAWISPAHLRLEATAEGLVVTDHSRHGTVVWRRCGPHERGEARPMRHARYTLREWDSLELYTGIELVLGDQRLITLATPTEPVSVLIDAPTAALRQISTAAAGTGQSPTVQSPTVESPTGRAPTGRAQSGQAQNGQAQSGQAQNGQGPRGSSQKGQSGAAGQGTKPAAAADRWT